MNLSQVADPGTAPEQPSVDPAVRAEAIDRARKLYALAISTTFGGERDAALAAFEGHMTRHGLGFDEVRGGARA